MSKKKTKGFTAMVQKTDGTREEYCMRVAGILERDEVGRPRKLELFKDEEEINLTRYNDFVTVLVPTKVWEPKAN